MAKLTSGPFFVPLSIDNTSQGEVAFLLIGFKNLTDETSTVHVTAHVCRDTVLYPETPPEIEFYSQKVKIPAGDCAVLRINSGTDTFTGNNMLRIAVEGDIEKEAEAVVIALSAQTRDERPVDSMVFKHEEFVEVDD